MQYMDQYKMLRVLLNFIENTETNIDKSNIKRISTRYGGIAIYYDTTSIDKDFPKNFANAISCDGEVTEMKLPTEKDFGNCYVTNIKDGDDVIKVYIDLWTDTKDKSTDTKNTPETLIEIDRDITGLIYNRNTDEWNNYGWKGE